jgi:IS30 family transposase
MAGSKRALSVFDSTIIELRRKDRWGVRAIAAAPGHSPGTISDEIKGHSDAG